MAVTVAQGTASITSVPVGGRAAGRNGVAAAMATTATTAALPQTRVRLLLAAAGRARTAARRNASAAPTPLVRSFTAAPAPAARSRAAGGRTAARMRVTSAG